MSDPHSAHPDEVVIASYLDGTLPGAARDGLEAHLAGCDACRRGVAQLAFADPAGTEAVPADLLARARQAPAAPPRASGGSRAGWALAAAAAIVLVAGGAMALRTLAPGSPPAPVERGAGTTSLRTIQPAAGSSIARDSLSFVWSRAEGADRYQVVVTDAAGRLVESFESREAGRPVAWPAGRPLPPPGPYLWSVRGLAADRVVIETRPVPFELR
jgi:anti-sigma factor RsiW